MRIVIAAGGTGGHIFPALCVADALVQQGVEVFWLGSHVGMEKKLVPDQFAISLLKISAIRGKGWCAKLLAPWRILTATWQAMRILRELKPDGVLAMGGFVCGPTGVAAWLLGIRLVIHEQNSVAGMTNRILARIATQVLQAFPDAFSPTIEAQTIGNPVRAEVLALPSPDIRLRDHQGPLRLLIVGGSQGARPINQLMIETWRKYHVANELQIWHQVGALDYEHVANEYKQLKINAKVAPFIDNIEKAYAWADLVIARAGALTVAEVAASGLASVFVPLPHAVDDHQYYNAKYLADAGAAMLFRQQQLDCDALHELLTNLMQHREQLTCMAQKARALAKPKATESVVQACLNLGKINE